MRARWILLAALQAAAGAPCLAQQGGPPKDTAAHATQSATDTATLVIQGRPVFTFRTGIAAASARDRRDLSAEMIDRALDRGLSDSITLHTVPVGTVVGIGSRGVFAVLPGDVDSISGQTVEGLAAQARDRLGIAYAEARLERSAARRAYEIGMLILATLALLAFFRLLVAARQLLTERLRQRVARYQVGVGGFTLVSAERMQTGVELLLRLLMWALVILAVYVWFAFALDRFPLTRGLAASIRSYERGLLAQFGGAILHAIPGLIAVTLIVVLTRIISRTIAAFFSSVERGELEVPWLAPEIAQPTRKLVQLVLWLFAIVAMYPYIPGSGSDVFKGLSVFAGVILSIGSSGIVNQAMSGLVLMYSRALAVGDYVRVGETEGTVTRLGTLATHIATLKQEEVTIPNTVMVASPIKNYTRSAGPNGILVHSSVTIGYDTPWRQVHELLLNAARRTPGLKQSPPPFVMQLSLSDFYVEYQVNAYLEQATTRVFAIAALHANIQDSFNEYGVQIMSPHYFDRARAPVIVPPADAYPTPGRSETAPAPPIPGAG